MNNTCFDCDVVRDLMPLVIDDAASGTSRGIVETHLKECPDCRGVMEEMRAELAERKTAPEDGDFVRFVKNTGKKLRRKKIIAILAIVVGVLGLLTGMVAYIDNQTRPVEFTPENVSFTVNENGTLTIAHTLEKGSSNRGMGLYVPDDGGVYFYMNRSVWPSFFGGAKDLTVVETLDWLYWNGENLCHWYMEPVESSREDVPPQLVYVEEPFSELRVGTPEDYFVLYRAGDVLTPGEVIEIHE